MDPNRTAPDGDYDFFAGAAPLIGTPSQATTTPPTTGAPPFGEGSAFGGPAGNAIGAGAGRFGTAPSALLDRSAPTTRRRRRGSPVRAFGITGKRVVVVALLAGLLVLANDYRESWTPRLRTTVAFPEQLVGMRSADPDQKAALTGEPGMPAPPNLGGGTGTASAGFYVSPNGGLGLTVLAAKKPFPLLPFDLGDEEPTAVDTFIGASDGAPVKDFATLEPGLAAGRLVCITTNAERLCAGDNDTSVVVMLFSSPATSDETVAAARNAVLGLA